MEFDWSASEEPVHTTLTALPSRDALWNRWEAALDLNDKQTKEALHYPYQLSNPKPRYYQEAAINRCAGYLAYPFQKTGNIGSFRSLSSPSTYKKSDVSK